MEIAGGRTLLHHQFINLLGATVIALTLANGFSVIRPGLRALLIETQG
jgi:hypothetical protein